MNTVIRKHAYTYKILKKYSLGGYNMLAYYEDTEKFK